MSYRTTQDVLEIYRDRFAEAAQWVRELELRAESPELQAAAAMAADELRTRSLSFQDALDTASDKTLSTYLQYEPAHQLGEALQEFWRSDPADAETLLERLVDFYKAVFQGLQQCKTTSGGTPATELFEDLESQTEAGISFQAWKLRSRTT